MIRNYRSLEGKCVTVMGLGLHGGGVSTARWLLKHGAIVTVTDMKTAAALRPSFRQLPASPSASTRTRRDGAGRPTHNSQLIIHLGGHIKADFVNAEMVVRNPAVPNNSPYLQIARKHGVPIENEATLFLKHCRSKNIIGVTGTRGKSTTATMIRAILRRKLKTQNSKLKTRVWLAGNIRTTPMLSIVDRVKPNDWVVLELSSWQLETMDEQSLSPHVAVVTNLLPDHLNRYTSMRAYARAKETIVRHQKRGDVAVLNKENPWTRAMAKQTKARVLFFQHYRGPSSVIQRTVLRVLGEHNRLNAEAAAMAVRAIGISPSIIRRALKDFSGIQGRLECIRTVRGVTFVNDTTATTPDATIAALRALSQNQKIIESKNHRNIILIAGGSDKNLSYTKLIPEIRKTCKAVVFLPGSATNKIVSELPASPAGGPTHNSQLITLEASSMSSAVEKAWRCAEMGDIVLLSPAAASFASPPSMLVPRSRSEAKVRRRRNLAERRGLFKHEFDRGDQFVRAVQKIMLIGRK